MKERDAEQRRAELLSHDDVEVARAALRTADIEHAIYGGRAANVYRRDLRLTYDIDFLVKTFDGLQEVLASAGFELEHGEHGTQDRWLIRAIRNDVGYDFCLAEIPLQEVAIARAQANDGLATPEDLVMLKMIAFRLQDKDDLRSIARAGTKLDVDYLRSWASAMDEHFRTKSRLTWFEAELARSQRKDNGHDLGQST